MFREFVKIVGRFFTTKDLDIFVLNAEKREWKEGKENGGRMARRTIQKEHKHYVNTGRILYGEEGRYSEMELVTENHEFCPKCGKLIDQLFSTYCGNCGEKLEDE